MLGRSTADVARLSWGAVIVSTGITVKDSDGFAWALRWTGDDRIGPGPHEHGIHELLLSFAQPDSVFIDVGAHVGHYALRMARGFSKVIAIEPNAEAAVILRMNLRLNGLSNVEVHGRAAHCSEGRLRLWDPFGSLGGSCTRTLAQGEPAAVPDRCGVSTLYFGPDGLGKYLGEVEATTIDRLALPCAERVAFIKIDVEGHEGKALAGARETIRRHQPALLIEMHDSMYGRHVWDEVVDGLAAVGYAWCSIALPLRSTTMQSDECVYIYAEPNSLKRRDDFIRFAQNVGGRSTSPLGIPAPSRESASAAPSPRDREHDDSHALAANPVQREIVVDINAPQLRLVGDGS